eukprot:3030207-Amphidinium_carterae.1
MPRFGVKYMPSSGVRLMPRSGNLPCAGVLLPSDSFPEVPMCSGALKFMGQLGKVAAVAVPVPRARPAFVVQSAPGSVKRLEIAAHQEWVHGLRDIATQAGEHTTWDSRFQRAQLGSAW